MTWDYSGDPASSDKDAVRFLIGDTDKKDPLVQDEEITATLVDNPNQAAAGAVILDALVAKASRFPTTRVGDISVSGKERSDAFAARAKELRKKSRKGARIFFGGTVISTNRGFHQDHDKRQPQFQTGQDDNPRGPDHAEHPHDHHHQGHNDS